jgi:hypothetical protein
LEHFREALYLPDSFFESCMANVPTAKRYLYKGLQNEDHTFSVGWRLYVPAGFTAMTGKGASSDEEI